MRFNNLKSHSSLCTAQLNTKILLFFLHAEPLYGFLVFRTHGNYFHIQHSFIVYCNRDGVRGLDDMNWIIKYNRLGFHIYTVGNTNLFKNESPYFR